MEIARDSENVEGQSSAALPCTPIEFCQIILEQSQPPPPPPIAIPIDDDEREYEDIEDEEEFEPLSPEGVAGLSSA